MNALHDIALLIALEGDDALEPQYVRAFHLGDLLDPREKLLGVHLAAAQRYRLHRHVMDRGGVRMIVPMMIVPVVIMVSPFAPHTAEELWHMLGHSDTLSAVAWPSFDPAVAREDEVVVPVSPVVGVTDSTPVVDVVSEAFCFLLPSPPHAASSRPTEAMTAAARAARPARCRVVEDEKVTSVLKARTPRYDGQRAACRHHTESGTAAQCL